MEHLSPPVLAEALQSVWAELDGHPELCPPAAWLEVAERLQRKMLVSLGIAIQAPDDRWYQRRVSLTEIKALCMACGLDPKTTPVNVFAAGIASLFNQKLNTFGLLDIFEPTPVPTEAPQPAKLSDHDKANIERIVAADSIAGEFTNYSAQLLRLINKADNEQRSLLALIYPDHVAAYDEWQFTKPLPPDEQAEVDRQFKREVEAMTGHVDIVATEPKPPLAGVQIIWEHSDYLHNRYTLEELRSGYYPEAAGVYEPDAEAIKNLKAGACALVALVPLQIFADGEVELIQAPTDYTRERCSFCEREGYLSPAQFHLSKNHAAYVICPLCVPRLVGSPAKRRPDDQQADQKTDSGGEKMNQADFTPAGGASLATGE